MGMERFPGGDDGRASRPSLASSAGGASGVDGRDGSAGSIDMLGEMLSTSNSSAQNKALIADMRRISFDPAFRDRASQALKFKSVRRKNPLFTPRPQSIQLAGSTRTSTHTDIDWREMQAAVKAVAEEDALQHGANSRPTRACVASAGSRT